MKNLFLLILIVSALTTGWIASRLYYLPKNPKSSVIKVRPRPYDKYTIEGLSVKNILPSKIEIGETIKDEPEFTSSLFSFSFNPTLEGKNVKRVTGLINIPKGKGPFPVIVMFRGYVDQKIYKTGDGTRRAAEFFAKNGFITIAPDFLGYGGSDKEAENIFESRFQTYITALVLLKTLESNQVTNLPINQQTIYIWGHSNGGQIALTILEITGKNYPTVLWAPVSKPFPYSILYYTDASEDRGKLIRHELAAFEETYDVELYSLTNYLDKIKTPLQIHQGTADDAVPVDWTNKLVKELSDLNLDLDYFTYKGADHNLNPSWNLVIARNLEFFLTN